MRKGYAFPVAEILLCSRKIGTANDSKIELVLFAFSVVLAINLTSVSDAVNTHDLDIVGDLVDDPVIAYANSPVIICSGKLPATSWTRIFRQRLNRGDYAVMQPCGELPEVSFGSAFEEDAIHGYLPLRLAR